MAYDENLAQRVREITIAEAAMTERKMFGGLAFMLWGHMVCGIVGEELMLRLGPDGADAALRRAHVRPMDFTGRSMTGIVFVAPAGQKGAALHSWIAKAIAFVDTLPPKRGKQRTDAIR